MSGLKPFRSIPENAAEWSQWMTEQDIPDPVSDTFIRGTKTFQSQNVATQTVAEDNNDYIVLIDAAVNETFWTTNKTTTSFTVNSSNATSMAKVNWVLMR